MRWRRNDSDAANHYQQNRRTYVSETSRCANRPHRRGDRAERRENLKTLPYWTRFPASHRAPPESSPLSLGGVAFSCSAFFLASSVFLFSSAFFFSSSRAFFSFSSNTFFSASRAGRAAMSRSRSK